MKLLFCECTYVLLRTYFSVPLLAMFLVLRSKVRLRLRFCITRDESINGAGKFYNYARFAQCIKTINSGFFAVVAVDHFLRKKQIF